MTTRGGRVPPKLVAVVATVGAVILLSAAAYTGDAPSLGTLFSLGGLGMGGTALIAWGRMSEAVDELKEESKDRPTRAEFDSMSTDVREIRGMLERRSTPRPGR